ncbi:hypothetical protein Mchl_5698 (plasmid) [Methylorubrum extorquens CM4]|nr:hypothetical protein Mchl_5698 [Methylorubrum extorquens CM4]
MSGKSGASVGSAFVRTGFAYEAVPGSEGEIVDAYGARWHRGVEGSSLVQAPLAGADLHAIHAYSPATPRLWLQISDRADMFELADAPLPGLVASCFALRGGWSFLEECADRSPIAFALLDWAEEQISSFYIQLIRSLAHDPNLIIYHDELGTDLSSYFSERDFRDLILPRMRRILERIRSTTSAPIGVFIRGSALSALSSVAELGVAVLGVDCNARGNTVKVLRNLLGYGVVLHGAADLVALGRALTDGDMRGTAILASEFAEARPAIAAPSAVLTSDADLSAAARGSSFLSVLDPGDLEVLGRIGPERRIIERAMMCFPSGVERAPAHVVALERPRILAPAGALPRHVHMEMAGSSQADVGGKL